MKIYTKQGDTGSTQVYSSEVMRLQKDHIILEAYGDIDSLNAQLGKVVALAQAETKMTEQVNYLQTLQHQLFQLGFVISDSAQLADDAVAQLEQAIDELQQQLPAQTRFILPGGSLLAAEAHLARTACRRAERTLVALSQSYSLPPLGLAFINRLSDYLFVLARYCNYVANTADIEV